MVAGSVATALLIVAGGAFAACSSDDTDPPDRSGSADWREPVGERVDLSAPGLHDLPAPPLESRSNPVRVWTGNELVVWAGTTYDGNDSAPGRLLGDGATLSLDDGRWTPMPASPFVEGLYQPLGAWDGSEVVIIGTECEGEVPAPTDGNPPSCPKGPAAAAWNPETGVWRRLDAPPIPVDEYSGERVLNGGTSSVGGPGSAVFTFGWEASTITWDRPSETWATVAPDWGGDASLAVCADPMAEQMVVVSVQDFNLPPKPGKVWVLQAGGQRWSKPLTVETSFPDAITCGDGSVVAGDYDGNRADLVDTASGAVTPVVPSTPAQQIEYVSAFGPWLFNETMGGLQDRERTVEVRLAAGGAWEAVGILDDEDPVPGGWSSDYVGSGAINGRIGEDDPLLYWRAPPSLTP